MGSGQPQAVHVIGAGPVGLMLTALLQPMDEFSVGLYEKRRDYTRTRMVRLAPYLVADSVELYRTDAIDEDSIGAIFDPAELTDALAFRNSIPADLMGPLRDWALGFCPLNSIERSLSDLIDSRSSNAVRRNAAVVTAEDAMAMLEPGDILIDTTGRNSLLRDHLTPESEQQDDGANTLKIRLEYALVITFLYGQTYDCNEYCKYYKNIENAHYKFIPMVQRTHSDGGVSHVTGIVNITPEEYEAMPARFDGEWLRSHFPGVAESTDRFIDKIKEETQGRDTRRPRCRPHTARSLPGSQRDGPSVANGGSQRPPLRPLAGLPGGRRGYRLALLSVDLAWFRMCDAPGWTPGAARPTRRGHAGAL